MIRHRVSAQALTELALVLPLLALIFVGVIELGFLLYTHVQVSTAAREGARAASLYRSTRYSSIDDSKIGNPPSCASGFDGLSVQQTIEKAILNRGSDKDGCPNTSGTIISTALGRLDTAPTPNWTVKLTPAFAPATSSDMPVAGSRATVELRYPYRLLLLSGLLPMFQDPVWVVKAVEFEYQQ